MNQTLALGIHFLLEHTKSNTIVWEETERGKRSKEKFNNSKQ